MSSAGTVADIGEHALLALIRSRVPTGPDWLPVGIGDDAAIVEPPRNRLEVITTDTLVEGVHFDRRYLSADDLGYRALAVNLSDVAAMGGTPRLALLSLVLPAALPVADLGGVLDGLLGLAREHDVHLVGGNITRSPGPLMIDLTVVGTVKRRQVLTRSGARVGDEIWVSGTIGSAAAGLQALAGAVAAGQSPDPALADCVARYRRPEARVRLGAQLGHARAASACMDLSDGLADAAQQVAAASGVGMVIDADLVPLDEAARDWFDRAGRGGLQAAMAGGDDYELLWTVRPRGRGRFRAVARRFHRLRLTRIGTVVAGGRVVLRRHGGDEPLAPGFAHFR